ncbi:hypothetical protein HDU67_007190 [Dinochytrium kinnereticum]|nr:hypothetical protein HDU67_007190 [Dinochytrium kinnereticum]
MTAYLSLGSSLIVTGCSIVYHMRHLAYPGSASTGETSPLIPQNTDPGGGTSDKDTTRLHRRAIWALGALRIVTAVWLSGIGSCIVGGCDGDILGKVVTVAEIIALILSLSLLRIPEILRPELRPSSYRVSHAINLLTIFCVLNQSTIILDILQISSLSFPYPNLLSLSLTLAILFINLHRFSVVDHKVEQARDKWHHSQGLPLPCRWREANAMSVLFFSWVNGLMRLGQERPLKIEDLPEMIDEDKPIEAVRRFQEFKNKHKTLLGSLFDMERKALMIQIGFGLFACILSLSGPALLYNLIDFIKNPEAPLPNAFLYITLLALISLIRPVIDAHSWQTGVRAGLRFKTSLINEIYLKSLRRRAAPPTSLVSSSEDEDDDDHFASTGKVITLLTTDTGRILTGTILMVNLIEFPVQIFFSMCGLYYVVGWASLVGLAVLCCVMPIMYWLTGWEEMVYDRLMESKDRRTNAVNEMLQGIRVVKYFAWEPRFLAKIRALRTTELKKLINLYLQNALNNLILRMAPILVAFFTLFTITEIAQQPLDAKKAFTCLTLFNTLRDPLIDLPSTVLAVFQIRVSFRRIEKFLGEKELERNEVPKDGEESGFDKGWFSWGEEVEGEVVESMKNAASSDLGDETTPLLSTPASSRSPTPPLRKLSPTPSLTTSTIPIETFTLRNLTLSFRPGSLTAICGATGSGKSSLLQALLGEMHNLSGSASLPLRNQKVAYVAQTSWLMNATIRDNILFGEAYCPERYAKVVRACALVKDLENLESGDLTEVGEKGINLSGGQKQRISLARAIYSPATHILLDDPLSAVDAPTAKHLLYNAIISLLYRQDRTVLLVTHATHLVLPFADQIVVMRNGEVAAAGDVKRVLEEADDDVVTIMGGKGVLDNEVEEVEVAQEVDSVRYFSNGRTINDAKRLVEDESIETGSVKLSLYLTYFQSAGGWVFFLGLILAMGLERVGSVAANFWVREWTRDRNGHDEVVGNMVGNLTALSTGRSGEWTVAGLAYLNGANGTTVIAVEEEKSSLYYSGIYALISMSWVVCFVITILVSSFGSYRASKTFHDNLMQKILNAPMRFFETTPIGRILNRASKDIGIIDQDIMFQVQEALGVFLDAISTFSVIAAITPMFILVIIPVGCVHWIISQRYITASRGLKRLESVTRSPIYSLFSESLNGVSTIRAYTAEQRFATENLNRIETNHRAFFYLWTSHRWLSTRVSALSAVIVFLAGFCIVVGRNVLDPGLVGISLIWALECSQTLTWLIREHAKLEMDMNAVERTNEYLNIEQELPAIIPDRRPAPSWPSHGALKVEHLEMKYSNDGPTVLTDVTFEIKGGEKLGVVGRTGAGKSSLSLCLFRIVEPSAGTITVDGINVADIGLHDLRSRLTIIPQDPVLFEGTVRSNLDPFEEHADEAVWECLEKVRFMDTVQSAAETGVAQENVLIEEGSAAHADVVEDFKGKLVGERLSLKSAVAEGGGNFSQGQRQLLCLARAMLKSSKIMVLDEATASVDNETDSKIQQAIRSKEFASTTVISIAHRLRTIADYDKILVLDYGRVTQFGAPVDLLQTDGHFRDMCKESGEFDELLDMAKAHTARFM